MKAKAKRNEKIVAARDRGLTHAKIAARYDLTPGRVSQILRAAATKPKRKGRKPR